MGPTSAADSARWAEMLAPDVPVLVTGAAGFIGSFIAERLLEAGLPVVGLDNLSLYYDVLLKQARLDRLARHPGFEFVRLDLADGRALADLFARHGFAHVVHMAAQAGVRHSIDHPHAYGEANLTGFLNVLEACRHSGVQHLVYASSSSVYGGNTRMPFRVEDSVDHPVSLYAATKKANELMAHSYSHLYGLPATGLRFFTVYGPWGRPDMAYFLFTRAIIEGRPIRVFNRGEMRRDFTYVDDIVEGVLRLIPRPAMPGPKFDRAAPAPGKSWAPHRVYNIGNNRSERLMDMIARLEGLLGRKAEIELLDMQPGDVIATWADVTALERDVGFRPATPLAQGLEHFVRWYRAFYGA